MTEAGDHSGVKWLQGRLTGLIRRTTNNFRVARDSLSIGRKRQWRFQILRTGLTTRSDRCTSPFPTCRCPKSFGASLLHVGGFAPQLEWSICGKAQPQRRLGS
jgi:hypothetical protein